jgi:protein involved in polysaccharide export with SLBB domain
VWLPGLGYVAAVDMDRAKFQSRLDSMLSNKFGRTIHTTVETYSYSQDPVRVEGLVLAPISRKWHAGLTVRSLLADANVRADGDANHVTVFQTRGPSISVDLGRADVPVRPGDVVVVEPLGGRDLVVILGPVLKPGAIPLASGLTLAKAIERAGGITGHGDSSRISLRHADGKIEILDLKRDGGRGLERGDWIGVALGGSQLFVSVAGWVPHPGLVDFRAGMTLTEAIRDAGGDPSKVGDAVKVIRILDKKMRSKKYHMTRILLKLDVDPVLQPSDSIVLGGR